jgi:AcrR family transcriptional regulator
VPGTAYNSPRRREAAAQTRQAVLDAARTLFLERGYVATTVQDIASAARVAAATVYTSAGGKPRLLQELITVTTGEAARRGAAELAAAAATPVDVVAVSVASIRQAVQDHGDIAELVLTTTHVDDNVAQMAALAEEAFRRDLSGVAARLRDLGALRGDAGDAVDVLAYYLGYPSWRRLVVDLGWSLDKAQAWLTARITEALIAAPAQQADAFRPSPRPSAQPSRVE